MRWSSLNPKGTLGVNPHRDAEDNLSLSMTSLTLETRKCLFPLGYLWMEKGFREERIIGFPHAADISSTISNQEPQC